MRIGMAVGVRLASLMLAFALVAACTDPAAPSATARQPPAQASPVAALATADPCWGGLTQIEAFAKRMAGELALLQPLVSAPDFNSGDAVSVIRRVSAILNTFKDLDDQLLRCNRTAGLSGRVEALLATLATTVEGSLSAPVKATRLQRDASVALVGLLPEVLALAEAARRIADGLARDQAVAQADPGAERPNGSLAPLPTSAAAPTPGATPGNRPTAPPGPAATSGWTQAAYYTALEWQQSVSSTYLGPLSSTLSDLANATFCAPGTSPEQCAAGREQAATALEPVTRLLDAHLSWMSKHPAAACFRDAYAADQLVANGYLAWIADWEPHGGDLTPAGQDQIEELRAADAKANAFISRLNDYFSDCR